MPTLYITPDEAEVWFQERGYDQWALLDEDSMEAALINACEWIDRLHHFRGMVEDLTQTRAWPRRDAFRDDGRAILGIPQEVKDAVLILAVSFAESDEEAEKMMGLTAAIQKEKVGSVEVQYSAARGQLRNKVTRILAPVLAPPMQGQVRRG